MTGKELGRAVMVLLAVGLFGLEAVAFAGLARTMRGAAPERVAEARSKGQVVSSALFRVALPAVGRALRGAAPSARLPELGRAGVREIGVATCPRGSTRCVRIVTIRST